MANGNSYLGLANRAEELNIAKNSQAEQDVSARAKFTSDLIHIVMTVLIRLLFFLVPRFVSEIFRSR